MTSPHVFGRIAAAASWRNVAAALSVAQKDCARALFALSLPP